MSKEIHIKFGSDALSIPIPKLKLEDLPFYDVVLMTKMIDKIGTKQTGKDISTFKDFGWNFTPLYLFCMHNIQSMGLEKWTDYLVEYWEKNIK